ncbi:MAG: hypothetical protein EZS28_036980, partial [Streblomastix strix]
KILVQITCGWNDQTSGGIFVDSCVFTDRNTIAKDDSEFSFIKIAGRSTNIQISNSVFNGGKFGSGGAITKNYILNFGVQPSSLLAIEKSVFKGIDGQTGPFIRSNENGFNLISTSIFRGAKFLDDDNGNHAALLFQPSQQYSTIRLDTFSDIKNGSAILLDNSNENFVIIQNQFINIDAKTSLGGAIVIINPTATNIITAQYNTFENNKGLKAGAIYIDASVRAPKYNIYYDIFTGIEEIAKAVEEESEEEIVFF